MSNSTVGRMDPSPLLCSVAGWFCRLLALALIATIGLLLLPYALRYVEGWERFTYLKMPMDAQAWLRESIGGTIREYLPTQIAGRDRTIWIMVIAALVGYWLLARLGRRLVDRGVNLRLQQSVEAWKSQMGLKQNSTVSKDLDVKLAALKDGGKEDREALLKIFAETKKKLAGMGRELAFLSVDIAGSTQMKVGEEQAAIEHDFGQYKTFVTGIFQSHGVLKVAWTPDGQMACFPNIDSAVNAGKAVIQGLRKFNREVKLMKSDFVVRCGVNAGFVYMDDKVPLEEVSDRVIDIAGHMQKHAAPNTVSVAKTLAEPLTAGHGFRATDQVVDDHPVYVWRPETPG